MRIVVAPDKFRGSLDARGVAAAVAEGVRALYPDARIDGVPMADGGEGTLHTLVEAHHGRLRQMQATGPLGEQRTSAVGLIDGAATAVVELAQVAGLSLVPEPRRDPLATTTYGVGELLAAALDTGVQRIILAVGGSATVDGGAGMMQALGLQLLDRSGRAIPPGTGGGRLLDIAHVASDDLHPLLHEVPITIAADALNPLTGPEGAAVVFAPQKGARPDGVARLDAGLTHWAGLIEAACGRDLRNEPGMGAAGGVALPLVGLADAQIVPGVDLMIESTRLTERIVGADLVITGEGRLDGQSLMGKVVGGVARLARSAGVPCVAIAGDLGEGHERCDALLDDYVSLTELSGSHETALREPAEWIKRAAARLARHRP